MAGRGAGLADMLSRLFPGQLSRSLGAGRRTSRDRRLQRWIEEKWAHAWNNVLWGSWLQEFFPLLHATFEEIERFVQAQQQSGSDSVRAPGFIMRVIRKALRV
jgi:hypothetical protein